MARYVVLRTSRIEIEKNFPLDEDGFANMIKWLEPNIKNKYKNDRLC